MFLQDLSQPHSPLLSTSGKWILNSPAPHVSKSRNVNRIKGRWLEEPQQDPPFCDNDKSSLPFQVIHHYINGGSVSPFRARLVASAASLRESVIHACRSVHSAMLCCLSRSSPPWKPPSLHRNDCTAAARSSPVSLSRRLRSRYQTHRAASLHASPSTRSHVTSCNQSTPDTPPDFTVPGHVRTWWRHVRPWLRHVVQKTQVSATDVLH